MRASILTRLCLLLFVAVVGAMQVSGADFSDLEPQPDLVVDDRVEIRDVTQLYEGNISVLAGGELHLAGSVIVFNSTEQKHYGVIVEEGGAITITNSRIRATNKTIGFAFSSYGRTQIRDSRFEGIYDEYIAHEWVGGFRIFSDNPVVTGSKFLDAHGFGIRFQGSNNVTFIDNMVSGTSTGLTLDDSSGLVKDNIFYNNTDRQVLIRGCDKVEYDGNSVNFSGMAGLVVVNTTEFTSTDSFYEEGLYVVYVSGSECEFTHDNFEGRYIVLEGREGAMVTMFDCGLNVSQVQAKSGSQIKIDRYIWLKVLSGDDTVDDAIVKVENSDGTLVAEGTTDETGIAELRMTVARAKDSGLEVYDPHTFKAVKGLLSGSGTANITSNSQIELQMSLPWLYIIGGLVFLAFVVVIVVMPPAGRRKRR